MLVGLVVGLVNGIGVGVFRVNPLIMTLGMASIVAGYLTVSAQSFVTGVPLVPDFVRELAVGNLIGSAIPKSLLLWLPVAALILYGLRYSGYGRMLYAVGDNPIACRLAGVRVWQVLLVTTSCARSSPRSAACSTSASSTPPTCSSSRRTCSRRWPRW